VVRHSENVPQAADLRLHPTRQAIKDGLLVVGPGDDGEPTITVMFHKDD